MARTLDEVYRQGLEALRDRLGRADMIRFLQQFERGSGDYAKERQAWVDRTSMAELLANAGRRQTKKGKRRGGSS
jgi:uncharacterized protein YciU (UPF0263 family)